MIRLPGRVGVTGFRLPPLPDHRDGSKRTLETAYATSFSALGHRFYTSDTVPVVKSILQFTWLMHTVPLAQLMDGQIAALRHWAKGRAREAASHVPLGPRNSRRISQEN